MSNVQFKTEEAAPQIRFESSVKPDKIKSEQTKREEFMNVIYVYVRAPGDMKSEFIDIAEETAYDAHIKRVDVERSVPKFVEDPETGDTTERLEKITFQEDRTFYTPKTINPWLEKIAQKKREGQIGDKYYDHCLDSFSRFKKKEEMPIDGYPLVNWKGIDMALREKALGAGLNTVEKIANMTSEAIQYLGMGAQSAKEKAKAFLLANSSPEQATIEISTLQSENRDMREQLSALQAKISEIVDRKVEHENIGTLRTQFESVTGKKPDMRWSESRIRQELEKEAA
jgi:chaperonin cofactor prefoldin